MTARHNRNLFMRSYENVGFYENKHKKPTETCGVIKFRAVTYKNSLNPKIVLIYSKNDLRLV